MDLLEVVVVVVTPLDRPPEGRIEAALARRAFDVVAHGSPPIIE
jgi:hypothetical protein